MSGMITDELLIEQYIKLRNYAARLKEEHEQALAPYKEGMTTIENVLLERLNERGADSTKTDAGTAYKSEIMTPKVTDRDAVLHYCVDHWSDFGSDMLQISVTKDAIKKFIQSENSPPPGVEVSYFTRINVRK